MLEALHKNSRNTQQLLELSVARDELKELLNKQLYLATNHKFYAHGNKPTKFMLALLKQRKRKARISAILTDDKNLVKNYLDIAKAFH